MKHIVKLFSLSALTALALILGQSRAFATQILTVRPTSSDMLNWTQFGPAGSHVANGQGFTTTGGESGTFSISSGYSYAVTEENGASGWSFNFAPGDYFVNTAGLPLTFTFNTPYSEVGAQIVQSNGNAAYTATITAYDGATELGSYSVSSTTGITENNTAPFLGVSSTTADITKVVYQLSSQAGTSPNVSLNELSLVSTAAAPTASSAGVPEPATLSLLGFALLGLGLLRRKPVFSRLSSSAA